MNYNAKTATTQKLIEDFLRLERDIIAGTTTSAEFDDQIMQERANLLTPDGTISTQAVDALYAIAQQRSNRIVGLQEAQSDRDIIKRELTERLAAILRPEHEVIHVDRPISGSERIWGFRVENGELKYRRKS